MLLADTLTNLNAITNSNGMSFGDCAVTGNVTALRNPLGSAEPVLQRCYIEAADIRGQIPLEPSIVPPLLDKVTPVHSVVPVNSHCPLALQSIWQLLHRFCFKR